MKIHHGAPRMDADEVERPYIPPPQRRARTGPRTLVNIKPTDRGPLRVGTFLYPERVPALPATRGDCPQGPRPCPFLRCRPQ